METQYMAFESDFYKVSNAIRAKGGPEEPMAFPDGFVYAIENIPAGGGTGSGVGKDVGQNGEIFNNYEPHPADDGAEEPANIAGKYAHAEGDGTDASGENAHSEGWRTKATGRNAHAEGGQTVADGRASHAEGTGCKATGVRSHAEGWNTVASGNNSHAEGRGVPAMEPMQLNVEVISDNIIKLTDLPAAGVDQALYVTLKIENISYFVTDVDTSTGEIYLDKTPKFTSGLYTVSISSDSASGKNSHAEGEMTKAVGEDSHAEGWLCVASGLRAHAEGTSCLAKGDDSHAEGLECVTNENSCHAEGRNTVASGFEQHVQGRYNIEDSSSKYAHIVGNGNSGPGNRSNAHTLDWGGNSWYQGSVLIGGADMDAPDAGIWPDHVVVKSSTPGSVKRFKITVDDTGTLKAEEIV